MKSTPAELNTIEAPESDYLFIETSNLPNAGKGLHTAITLYKDEIICLYGGEILSTKEAEKRANLGKNQYFISLLNGKILDSINSKCFARFANDAAGFSPSKFKNNAKISLNEQNQVCLIASKKIKAGEEIFCSYGKRYWKK
ncbi:MAG: SET domain-containing protein-lysine N-methyltransferase [Bacteroidetes bacterium B1(2017)]|nr:MAG: SET domain-containing protein-lysine N-methyltransferase [Bacteroidetes bacterium B1(2017)]